MVLDLCAAKTKSFPKSLTYVFHLELCDNLDNKIIEPKNFIMIKIIVFYYRDNSKFLDITVYYTYISAWSKYEIRHAHMLLRNLLLLHYDNYSYQCEI